jgi:hypothetical protein
MNQDISIDILNTKAVAYTKTVLDEVFVHNDSHQAVIVYDTLSTLSTILSHAYHSNLPHAVFINFHESTPEQIHAVFDTLGAEDMVILIQSTNFRLDAFRIRVELFKRKIKVLEHPHLSRMKEDEVSHYIDAIEYDKEYIRNTGRDLKSKIDSSQRGVIYSGEEELHFPEGFESAKMNIGDYSEMPNTGGQFPIGEVFTESKELTALHGKATICSFADTTYKVNIPQKPITIIIEGGRVVGCEDSTPAFDEILALIREGEEGEVWVRELGFGLNRGFSKTKIVSDIGSYERMCGVHLSLGRKHGMYGKPGFKRGDGKFHIDIFVDTKTVEFDNEIVFEDEAWCV